MIRLSRKLDVLSYDVSMVIGREDKSRGDILSFLKLMKERNGPFTSRVVNLEFFRQTAEDHPFGPRWLKAMHGYGFIDPFWGGPASREPDYYKDSFVLNEEGAEVASSGVVTIPELGDYVAHITADPALEGHEVLFLERTGDGNSTREWYDEQRRLKEGGSKSPTSMALPTILDRYREGGIVELPAARMQKVFIRQILGKAFPSKEKMFARLEINLEEGEPLELCLVQDDRRQRVDTTLELPYDVIIRTLIKGLKMRLDDEGRTILADFEDLKESEVETFRRKMPDQKIYIPGLGTFDAAFIEERPLRPSDLDAAVKWANKLLVGSVRNFVDERSYDGLLNEAADRFSAWYSKEDLSPRLLFYREALIASRSLAGKGDPMYWYLNAPNDLDGRVEL